MRRRGLAVLLALSSVLAIAGTAGAKVLTVGSYHGLHGRYDSIQTAVDAARSGDWILIGPGDYKTSSIRTPKGRPEFPAGVLITKPDLHIRGMNRSTVIVDGTKPGSAGCSRRASAQNYGHTGGAQTSGYGAIAAAGRASGLNGLMVYKASNVSIENLTACNFLGGSADAGNEIWWNGGDRSGKIGGHGYHGAYLTATSTYLEGKSKAGEFSAAKYGVFSSNWSGGAWDHLYASNLNDSGFYIGACRQVCDQTLNHGRAEYNALGYSGTNSGGRLVIENSEFDNNETGVITNSENVDEPAPQNGACPHNATSPITHTHSCWVFMHNYVHDNNNPNVPAAGAAAAGPVGTGMVVSGGRNDTIMHNRFVNNDAWGLILSPYLDSGHPCYGGTFGGPFGPKSCVWDEYGDALIANTFSANGGFHHPSNGDFAQVNVQSNEPTDCYSANTGPGGAGVQPAGAAAAQAGHPSCDGALVAAGQSDGAFLGEALCDSRIELSPGTPSPCPSGPYPRVTKVVMHPLPPHLQTMPDPCEGVPNSLWCRRKAA